MANEQDGNNEIAVQIVEQPTGQLRNLFFTVKCLVGRACMAGANEISIDVREEGGDCVFVIEDDAPGMTRNQLDWFFTGDDFYTAEEIHVATTRDGETLKAHSYDPPAYGCTDFTAMKWEVGTRVEVKGISVPDDFIDRISNDEIVRWVKDAEVPDGIDATVHYNDATIAAGI